MNCIAHQTNSHAGATRGARLPARILLALLLVAINACAVAFEQPVEHVYDVMYTVTPIAKRGTARVRMRVEQSRRLLREVEMRMPAAQFTNIEGDGGVTRTGDSIVWRPDSAGGTLQWTVSVPHLRYGQSYDAWLGGDWGLFRASDIMPPARTRTVVDARSATRLRFDLPEDWSAVTQYVSRDGVYNVSAADRRFARPAGWILLGKLGIRIDTIAGTRVVVGGPTGQGVRRMDMLALLHWTLPQFRRILPDFPKRIAIVSARDSMWRGGLSGPRSLYIHAGLPLISENATSTLLHELLHVGTGLQATDGADWIVEGLAEYYSLEILRRSRTISNDRFAVALKNLAKWGTRADALCTDNSTAATTARAVGVFAELSRELKENTKESRALDEILRSLAATPGRVSVNDLKKAAAAAQGGTLPRALRARNLPGC